MSRERVPGLLLAIPLLLGLIACGNGAPPAAPRPTPTPTLVPASPSTDGATVTDMAGRQVRVPSAVDTVVALSPAAAEFALALGLEVVGRTTDAADIAGLEDTPAVGSALFPDFNAAAALDPDLLIADAVFQGGRERDFERFPYPVFVMSVPTLSDVSAGFVALGAATGREAEAAAEASRIQDEIDDVIASVRGEGPVRVLILTGGGRDIYAASDDSYIGSMVTALGAENVLGAEPQGAPIPGFGLAEPAHVAVHDPDVVLLLSIEEGALAAELLALPEWAANQAVINDRLVELDTGDYLRNPGPRAPVALAALAEILYP